MAAEKSGLVRAVRNGPFLHPRHYVKADAGAARIEAMKRLRAARPLRGQARPHSGYQDQQEQCRDGPRGCSQRGQQSDGADGCIC